MFLRRFVASTVNVLHLANSMVNPFVYSFRMPIFKAAFKERRRRPRSIELRAVDVNITNGDRETRLYHSNSCSLVRDTKESWVMCNRAVLRWEFNSRHARKLIEHLNVQTSYSFFGSAPGCILLDSEISFKIMFLFISSRKRSTIVGTKLQIMVMCVLRLVHNVVNKKWGKYCG